MSELQAKEITDLFDTTSEELANEEAAEKDETLQKEDAAGGETGLESKEDTEEKGEDEEAREEESETITAEQLRLSIENAELKARADEREKLAVKEEEVKPPKPMFEGIEFVDEESFAEIFEDRGKFNALLAKVANASFQVGREQGLKDTIPVIRNEVSNQLVLKDYSRDFLAAYPAIAQNAQARQMVAGTLTQIRTEHPDWGLEKAFGELTERVEALGAKKAEGATVNEKRFTKQKTGSRKTRKVEVKPTGVTADILDLVSLR